jgi:DNA-binding NtrC family response regulator
MIRPEQEGVTVLVADSEERVLRQVSTALEKAGFAVFTALGRSATMEFCQDRTASVQLAIIDSAMGSNAPELVRELCHCHPLVRVLFTGNQDESNAFPQVVPEGHSCSYLKKPFRRSRLLGSVLKAIDGPLARPA